VKPKRTPPRARRLSLARRLALILLVASAAGASATSPTVLDMAIRTIRTMQAPHLVGDSLILTYHRLLEPVRFVGARFQHERWAVLHVYSVNEYGVFVLDYPLPRNAGQVGYRFVYKIVVDGLLMPDPSNPVKEIDDRGVEVSVYEVESEVERSVVNPEVEAGRATFVYRGEPGSRVSLVGDFNAWDPFAELMSEIRPGEFTATIEVRPGRHYYAYFAEGRKVLDEANSETSVDPDGRRVSSFTVPYTRSD
jgi:hypothetical protein